MDINALSKHLAAMGLQSWQVPVADMITARMSASNHGDYSKWEQALTAITDDPSNARDALLQLSPWRKGPFQCGDIEIDAEWRSDLKWARLKNKISPLAGKNVLDIGSGNGFYALQMQAAGANFVLGVDPTLLFVMQFLAVNEFARTNNVFVIPARLHELPLPSRKFDTTFSMGVLYHQRDPLEHLEQLRQTLLPGGELILETIYLPGDATLAKTPDGRYARMRNVWLLPTLNQLTKWMEECGYRDITIVDQSMTTVAEQRATDWMTFESLREALDPDDSTKTIEGWPAPHRVVVTAAAD